jgi:hypothetical protein
MDDLDDELDLRYHRDLNPEVYYRFVMPSIHHYYALTFILQVSQLGVA